MPLVPLVAADGLMGAMATDMARKRNERKITWVEEQERQVESLYVLCYDLAFSLRPLSALFARPLAFRSFPWPCAWMRVVFLQIAVAFPGFALQVQVQVEAAGTWTLVEWRGFSHLVRS